MENWLLWVGILAAVYVVCHSVLRLVRRRRNRRPRIESEYYASVMSVARPESTGRR